MSRRDWNAEAAETASQDARRRIETDARHLGREPEGPAKPQGKPPKARKRRGRVHRAALGFAPLLTVLGVAGWFVGFALSLPTASAQRLQAELALR